MLWMMRGETLMILAHGVKGEGQLCPLRGDATLCVLKLISQLQTDNRD